MQRIPMQGFRKGENIQRSHLATSLVPEKTTKMLYQKDKEGRRLEKASSSGNRVVEKDRLECYYCGQNRHPNDGPKLGYKDSCPAKNATCKECKKTGHFVNMPACRAKKVSCIKIEDFHSTKFTNMVKVKSIGPVTSIPVEVEANTGANIAVMKADVLQELYWVELEPTDVHIRGYSVIVEPCFGKSNHQSQNGSSISCGRCMFHLQNSLKLLVKRRQQNIWNYSKGFST